jgi:hypothetical protein
MSDDTPRNDNDAATENPGKQALEDGVIRTKFKVCTRLLVI